MKVQLLYQLRDADDLHELLAGQGAQPHVLINDPPRHADEEQLHDCLESLKQLGVIKCSGRYLAKHSKYCTG